MPAESLQEKRQILVFDVNETLLNIQALEPLFAQLLGTGTLLKQWFANMLLYSQTATLAGVWVDFSAIARLSLEMTTRVHGVELSADAVRTIAEAMKSTPAHPEVPHEIVRLSERGFRLVALTNSAQPVVEAQLRNAGLYDLFERVLSVDSVRKFKPHPAVYEYAAKAMKVAPGDLTMIAAHAWDLVGANAVGLEIAFIERTPGSWFGLQERPRIFGPTLAEVAAQLIASESAHRENR